MIEIECAALRLADVVLESVSVEVSNNVEPVTKPCSIVETGGSSSP